MNSQSTNNEISAEAILDELQEVISDIDSFMFDWLQRFNHCAQQFKPGDQADEQLRRRIKEFQAQQRQWESQRKAEQEQLQANADQLTEAWLRLEAEQRAFLQTASKATSRSMTAQPDRSPTEPTDIPTAEPRPADPSPGEAQTPDQMATANTRVAMPRDVISPDAAVRQFEILKSELSSHRQPAVGRSH